MSHHFSWENPPKNFKASTSGMNLITSGNTDFWNDQLNGHLYLTNVQGNFSMFAHVKFFPNSEVDQCGLIVRIDGMNWFKIVIEYHINQCSLCAVMTTRGYSDYSRQIVASTQQEMWFSIKREDTVFKLFSSSDGKNYKEFIFLQRPRYPRQISIGFCACSPCGSGCTCFFDQVQLKCE